MTLPSPRKLPFKHIGGPADGTDVPVTVDDNDVPVEVYQLLNYTAPDAGVDPMHGLASHMIYSTYERDTDLGDEGFIYVFRFRGETVDVADAA